MPFERVHTVWDFYDGIRSGLADHEGAPHFFECTGDWTNDPGPFRLSPVSGEFMKHALLNWEIYQSWERKHVEGAVSDKTHPGRGGIDIEYDKSQAWLDQHVKLLTTLPALFNAEFRQLDRLPWTLAKLEVQWTRATS